MTRRPCVQGKNADQPDSERDVARHEYLALFRDYQQQRQRLPSVGPSGPAACAPVPGEAQPDAAEAGARRRRMSFMPQRRASKR